MSDRWGQMLETLRANFSADSDVADLEYFLAARGLDRQEIGEVLSLYFGEVEAVDAANASSARSAHARSTSLRVQGPHERGRFSVDAWGYLIMLHESGVVSEFDFEQLVERALFHIDGRIGMPEIRALADDVGLDAMASGSDRTLLH
jgi:Smg protein